MTTVLAHAKLTWYLEITGTRPDGYHLLRSEMTSLALHDELTIDPDGDYLHIPNAPYLPTGPTNLVRQALALVGRTAGITLMKHIPTGGGLGGGSADAAAVLRWAGGVSDEQALRLGGDVPFCLRGGRCEVAGIGEELTPLPYEERQVTLLLPPFSINTKRAYAAYDELVRSGERPGGRNHLEAAACAVDPRMATALAWARAEFGDVQLAGSGSTMFVAGHVNSNAARWDVTSPVGALRVVQTVTTPGGR